MFFTFLHPSSIVTDALRLIFSLIDGIVYGVLAFVTAVFYNVANAQLISGTMMHDFFSRIQLILGIIVMFKVAMSIFMGILNPDSISDKKTGFGGIVKRVIIVLIMIVLIVPLDIPGADIDDISSTGQVSWNARMNASGIAFGTLFELQSRLLKQNVLAKLILGKNGSKSNTVETNMQSGMKLSRIIFKCFFTINMTDDGEYICEGDSRIISLGDTDLEVAYDLYNDDDSSALELLTLINLTCSNGESFLSHVVDDVFQLFGAGDPYAFNYTFLLSTIVGIFCVFVMISYTVDAAIRLVKLMILYMISPVPIISYIDPKTEKNFQNWLKTVLSTYLDLFIRLIIIYIILFLITEIDKIIGNGQHDILGLESGGLSGGFVGAFSVVFIYLGLFMFARKAPKFITDTLGLQNNKGLFAGLTSLIGGISSGVQGYKSSQEAIKTNTPGQEKLKRSKLKSLGAGLINGVDGMGGSYSDYEGAKDRKFRAAIDKINQQNAIRRQNAQSGVTFGQSLMAQAKQDITGDSRYHQLKRAQDKRDAEIKQAQAQKEKFERQHSAASAPLSEAIKRVTSKAAKVQAADDGRTYSLQNIERALAGPAADDGSYKIKDITGIERTFRDADALNAFKDQMTDKAANEYLKATVGTDADKTNYQTLSGVSLIEDHTRLLMNSGVDYTVADVVTALKKTSGDLEKDMKTAASQVDNLKNGTVDVGETQVSYADLPKEIAKEEAIMKGSDGKISGKS